MFLQVFGYELKTARFSASGSFTMSVIELSTFQFHDLSSNTLAAAVLTINIPTGASTVWLTC
jgi:hypothetical protein